jgi:hypothetical protein
MNLDQDIIEAIRQAIIEEKNSLQIGCIRFDLSVTSDEDVYLEAQATHLQPAEHSVKTTYEIEYIDVFQVIDSKDVRIGDLDRFEIEILHKILNTGEYV